MDAVRKRAESRAWQEYAGDTRHLDHSDPGWRKAERKAWHRLQKNLRAIAKRYS